MYKLVVCIVPHESGEIITNAAKQAGGLWPAQFSVQFSELFRGMLADDAAVNGEIAVAALAVRRGG